MSINKFLNRINRKDQPIINFRSGLFKLFLFILVSFSLAFVTKQIYAQTLSETINNWVEATDVTASPNVDKFMGGNTNSSLLKVQDIFIPLTNIQPLMNGQRVDLGTYRYVVATGGALGTINNYIAQLNTPAASGVEYIASVIDGGLLGKPAYAQGVGFAGLQPILPVWKSFRNMVYILSAVVFIVVALMIVLRVKISPQAVISIQSAIPQIVTTLILVTFSYAIAGLMIDLGNLIQGVVVSLFFAAKGTAFTQNLFTSPQIGQSGGALGLTDLGNWLQNLNTNFNFSQLANPDFGTFNMLALRSTPSWIGMMLLGGLLGSVIFGTFLGGLGYVALGQTGANILQIGSVFGTILGGGIGAIIIPILICIIVAIWLIKLYFGLFKAYVTIIFKIILGPLEIGMGAFPNSKTGFSTWIWDLLSNIAVFPIVNIFLILLNYIIDSIYGFNNMWAPSAIYFTGELSTPILAGVIGLAGLSMLSKMPELIPQVIFALKPSPWGQAIGQNLGTTSTWVKSRAGDAVADPASYLAGKINSLPFAAVWGGNNTISNALKGK